MASCGPGRYRKNFEVPGTVAPWAFDFGFENGHITAVQVVSLTGPLDVLMNRAALVSARAADTWEASKHAGRQKPDIVAVSDQNPRPEPVQYLRNRTIDVLSISGEADLRERLGTPLARAGVLQTQERHVLVRDPPTVPGSYHQKDRHVVAAAAKAAPCILVTTDGRLKEQLVAESVDSINGFQVGLLKEAQAAI